MTAKKPKRNRVVEKLEEIVREIHNNSNDPRFLHPDNLLGYLRQEIARLTDFDEEHKENEDHK